MTIEQLKEAMKALLAHFNDEGVEITDQTVHNTILTEDDGFGSANSKRLYKAFVRWVLIRNGHEDRSWRNNWMQLSVQALAEKLLRE